jgi:L-ascorbate metabolism protein UlaG (beta-lactamase superfamily)
MFRHEGVTIAATGHSGFRITAGQTIYIDPFQLRGSPPSADVVFVTHEHHDHLSPDDLRKVVTPATTDE